MAAIANPIVIVNVNQQIAPFPNNLQNIGAMISNTGTTLPEGVLTNLTQLEDLIPHLVTAEAISAATWSGGTVTFTASAPHGYTVSTSINLVVTGMVPAGYNYNFLCTITSSTQFTAALASNPGAATVFGTYQPAAALEILGMATTYFSQGFNYPVNVIEFGNTNQSPTPPPVTPDTCVATFSAWLIANPFTVYEWLVPRSFDAKTSFLSLLALYENPEALVYFHITTTISTYTDYSPLQKCAITSVEAPSVILMTVTEGSGFEFSAAAFFYQTLIGRPSDTNKVAPFAFRFLFGVTPYPTSGTGPLLTALAAANCNYISTGAEGGISDAVSYPGCTQDGRDFLYWYATDWTNINLNLDISNEIINGSNNPINPLYISQPGIDRLQARGAATLSSGAIYGLLQGSVLQTELDSTTLDLNLNAGLYAGKILINAIPFITYYTDNPSDYRTGTYNGLSATVVTSRGFIHIIFNLTITDFITQ